MLWLRFGLSAPVGHENCTPNRAANLNVLHRLGCRNVAWERTRRHDDLETLLVEKALSADVQSFRVFRKERLAEAEGSQARPGDIALNMGEGRVLVDVIITNLFALAGQTNLINAGSPGAVSASAYIRKLSKWRNLLDDHQLSNTMHTT